MCCRHAGHDPRRCSGWGRGSLRLVACTVLAAGCGVAVRAQGISTDLVALAPINVTAVLPDDPAASPGAAAVLGSEELARWRPYTLHDAFGFLAGLRTIDDDVLGRRSGIAVRGAPARRSRKVLLLEDGTPINAASYLDPSAHYTPPMERLERIDVLKGAGHVVHGPINNHGIVNFRNRRPTAAPETVLEMGWGNLAGFKRHLRHTRTDGPVGTVLAYTGLTARGVFDVERTRYDDLFASVDWAPSAAHRLRFAATCFRERSHYDESNLTPIEFVLDPFRKRGRFGQEFNTFALVHLRMDLVHTIVRGDTVLSTKLFATEFDRPRFTVEPGETPVAILPRIEPSEPFEPARGLGHMIARDRHYRTLGWETRGEMARPAGGAAATHVFQFGVRAERQWLNDRRTAGEPGEILHVRNRGTRTRDDAYRATAGSVFLQDVIRHAGWRITPGARLERFSQSKARLSLPADPGPHASRRGETHLLFLPSVTALKSIGSAQLFANLGRGYTPAFARTALDFWLKPETGLNAQIGARATPRPGLSWEAALFSNWIRDTVVQLPFSIDHRDVYLNSEDSVSRGADMNLRIEAVGRRGLRPFAELAYGFVDARFTAGAVSGRRVPEVPRHAGSLSLGVERTRRWSASITLGHFGSFFTDPVNTRELTLANEDGVHLGPEDSVEIREPALFGRVASHTLLSARVSFSLAAGRVSLWLQGRNLTDRLYVLDLQNGIRPGARRTMIAGFTLTL